MSAITTTLTFHEHRLDAVHFGGQMWLRADQIDLPLGYGDERSVRLLYTRHADEFGADETRVVSLPTEGGIQDVRVFSLRGARLLALFSRTPPAKAFRRWVLDVLEGRVRRQPVQAQLALPGTYRLPTDTVRMLNEVADMLEAGHPAIAMLNELKTGARPLPEDPALEHLAERFRGLRASQGEINRGYRQIAQEARRYGYSWEAVKLAARGELSAGAN